MFVADVVHDESLTLAAAPLLVVCGVGIACFSLLAASVTVDVA